MAYKVFIFFCMKEIGERLRETRKQNGVSQEEASNDLKISLFELESLENGNYKAFKDVYELKKNLQSYAKYLGINENDILNEFNDFLFEKTSKISIDDIKNLKEKKETVKKVSSPYTNIKPSRYNLAPIVLILVLLVFISLIVYLVLAFFRQNSGNHHDLKPLMEVEYELTQ